ncbi:uncharacterized protein LOC129220571 [Uloborus diversus]|uniref:uncharacterized protein LOC129220571 n=1 Tax=Uloborus diversus TaxID=327109 RepID=UPI00240A3E33|nr:uncharacterized protein LOC129220571 [Uloborus diversus]
MLDTVPDISKYLGILALSLLIYWTISRWFHTRSFPPGPAGLPVLGYGLFLGNRPNVVLSKLRRKYGDIFSFYTGPQLFICVSDYQLAKEILNHPLTLARPPQAFAFLRGCGGFSGKSGEEWTEQRRFAVQTMRNLGLGKGLWEIMIQESASDFVEEIRNWNGKPHNIEGPLQTSQAINNIALLFGRHLDRGEDKADIEIIKSCSRTLMQYFSSVSVNIALPWLANILTVLRISGYHNFMKILREFEAIFSREVEMRMKAKDSLTKEDFIGCYLREMEKKNNEGKPHTFNVDNLLGNLFLLFVAGLDSTLASIGWLLLLMADHPDIQKKVHEEIDAAFGRDGTIYFDDKVKLPYTMATILEMHRWVSIAAIYPPRYPLETFEFHGYTIPKGSNVICNSWEIMHDPKYFKNPMDFEPERFLSDDGTKAGKYDGYLPFSTGKRNCPGEGIAMMTSYLYFVSILQKFNVTPKPGEVIDLDYVFGGALLPKPQELRFLGESVVMLDTVPDISKYLGIFALSLLIYWTISRWFQTRNYPPGPAGLPVLGYGLFLGNRPTVPLSKLRRKYGDIFSFYTGPQLFICVSDYHLAKEILNHPLTLARPPQAFAFLRGCGGFPGKSGEEWTEQRRFAVQTMRNLGLGKGLWETMIQESTSDFLEEIRNWNGKPHNIEGPLQTSQAINNIALLFGRHLDKEEDKTDIEIIKNCSRTLLEYFSSVSVNIALPWLANIFRVLRISGYHDFMITLREFEAIFSREVEVRMKAKDSLSKEDFIGLYLREMEKKNNDGKPHTFNVDNLLGNLFLLFISGLDSTLSSIGWLLLLMADHPDVQKKVQEEIDAAFGRDGTVYFDDKVKLPYTMATILEMHRWVSIAAIYPPRYPTETFEFHGYTIPKGSNVICNSWEIMHDPKYFKNPMDFKPERFLNDDGTKAGKYDGYLPFSTGKRNCPGEAIAMMTSYLYFVSILQKFNVTPKPGEDIDLDYVFGGALLPKPQKLCFLER